MNRSVRDPSLFQPFLEADFQLSYNLAQLGHTLRLANGVKPPMVVLKQPLLGEVFGAGSVPPALDSLVRD